MTSRRVGCASNWTPLPAKSAQGERADNEFDWRLGTTALEGSWAAHVRLVTSSLSRITTARCENLTLDGPCAPASSCVAICFCEHKVSVAVFEVSAVQLAPERIARLASCALQSSSICPRVPPPLYWRVLFRRDLHRSHTPRHIAISRDRTAATAPHRAHSRPLPTRRSSLAVPARAHVPVYAVLPLFAHLEIPAQCPAPPHRHLQDEGPGRLRGLVRLKVARAG